MAQRLCISAPYGANADRIATTSEDHTLSQILSCRLSPDIEPASDSQRTELATMHSEVSYPTEAFEAAPLAL